MLNINHISEELDTFGNNQAHNNCKPELAVDILGKRGNSLKILHLNIRSVNHNFESFRVFIFKLNLQCDIIVLSECWLKKDPIIPSLEGYLCYYSKRIQHQNDGVILFIKKELQHDVTEPIIPGSNTLMCNFKCFNLSVIGLYRSPSIHNIDEFLNSLDNVLTSVTNFKNLVIIGDLNINITSMDSTSQSNEYLNLLASHGLLPAHQLPTRGGSCIDHVMVRSDFKSSTLVFDTAITDHRPVLLCLGSSAVSSASKVKRTVINYSAVIAEINETDFSAVTRLLEADETAGLLVSTLKTIVDKHTTVIISSPKHTILKPWITPGLLRCIRNRDQMNLKVNKEPNNYILKITFTRYRNFCNKLLKNLKIAYEKSEFESAKNNPKATWNIIKQITNTNRPLSTPTELLSVSPDNITAVNRVNDFFSNIGKSLAEKLIVSAPPTAVQTETTQSPHSFALWPTDEAEVQSIILGLRADCAVGWDGISSKILKSCCPVLVPIITHVCNCSISSGRFPKVFKKALVHPIYKAGDRRDVNNYRPISVLPSISKILEKILNNRLTKYLESNKILAPNQYGFRAGRSAEGAVGCLVDNTVSLLDSGKKCLGIFLDLSKAFDTVSVPHLLRKLEKLGIRGHALKIFHDYLSDRTQCVKIDNVISDSNPIVYGVPQGSVIGPTLFLIYIDALCRLSLPNCSVFAYADDTALLVHGDSWTHAFECAEQGLRTVMNWLTSNLLTLNPNKTMYMTFSIKASSQPDQDSFNLKAHNCPVTAPRLPCSCPHIIRTDNIKYLGVQIDNQLTWKLHLRTLTLRVRRLVSIMKRLRHSAVIETLQNVYCALGHSILNYCITAWGGAAKTHLLQLERAQRAVLKVMTFKPYRYPTTQLYDNCQILTVRQLFIQQIVLRKHSTLPFVANYTLNRRKYQICSTQYSRTALAQRHYNIISNHLYNIVNKNCNIYPMTRYECKKSVQGWLQKLNYEDTEQLLKIPT